jgi:hypothetical protein
MRSNAARYLLMPVAALLGLATLPVATLTTAQTAVVATPLNNAAGSLAVDHLSGAATLALQPGEGARFGTPTADAPVRVTVARRPTLVSGRIEATTTQTIYLVTGRTGDTLTGLTATEGTTDRAYYKGDPVAALITAGTIAEIQEVANAGGTNSFKLTGDQVANGEKTFVAPDAGATLRVIDEAEVELHAIDDAGTATMASTAAVSPTGYAGIYSKAHNRSADAPTTAPFFNAVSGTPFTNTPIGGGAPTTVVDNVHAMGFERVPGVLPGYSENIEHYWHTQYTTEWHNDFISMDGTVHFRPQYAILPNDNYRVQWIYTGYNFDFFSRLNTSGSPTLRVFMNDGDAGKVTVTSSADPFEAITGTGSMYFTGNPGTSFTARSALAADASNATRNGPSLQTQGYYWNGSASTPADVGLSANVTGNGTYQGLLSVGNALHRYLQDGKVGHNVALGRITENLVMNPGYVAAVNNATPANATYRLIGLNASDQVSIDPDRRGTTLMNNVAITEQDLGGGLLPIVTLGNAAIGGNDTTVAAWFKRNSPSKAFWFGADTDTGETVFRGTGGLTYTSAAGGSNVNVLIQNNGAFGTNNMARLYLAPHSGYDRTTSPYLEFFNNTADGSAGVDSGFRVATFTGGTRSVKMTMLPSGATTFTGGVTAASFAGSGASLTGVPESAVTGLVADLAAKAPLASPTFTGTATAPTVQGDTAAAGNLNLSSTGHATKGLIKFGANSYFDESAGSLYIKRQSFTDGLRIEANGFTTNAISILSGGTTVAAWGFAGQLYVANGSQAGPTYSFQTKTGTGFFLGGPSGTVADNISVTVTGLQRVVFGGTGDPRMSLMAASSTTQRTAAVIDTSFPTATDASRLGRLTLYAGDFSGTNREGIRIESNGSAPLIGFLGGTAVARQPANADTSGATLAALETEVNELKQLIRNYNLMAP